MLKNIDSRLRRVEKRVSDDKTAAESHQISNLPPILTKLPLSNEDDLDELERVITSNRSAREALVNHVFILFTIFK